MGRLASSDHLSRVDTVRGGGEAVVMPVYCYGKINIIHARLGI